MAIYFNMHPAHLLYKQAPAKASQCSQRFGSHDQTQASLFRISPQQQGDTDVQHYVSHLSHSWNGFPQKLKDKLREHRFSNVYVAKTLQDIKTAFPEFSNIPSYYSEGPSKFFTMPGTIPRILMPMVTHYQGLRGEKKPFSIPPERAVLTFSEEVAHIVDDVAHSRSNPVIFERPQASVDAISSRIDFLRLWNEETLKAQQQAPEWEMKIMDRALGEPREAFGKILAGMLNPTIVTPWRDGDYQRMVDSFPHDGSFNPDIHYTKEQFQLLQKWFPKTRDYIQSTLGHLLSN